MLILQGGNMEARNIQVSDKIESVQADIDHKTRELCLTQPRQRLYWSSFLTFTSEIRIVQRPTATENLHKI